MTRTVTVRSIRVKAGNESITMLTAYDAPTMGVVDEMGIDIVLVDDNVGNTALGYDSMLPVTVEDVTSRAAAMACTIDDALVVIDMPFLLIGVDEASSVEHCSRVFKEVDADAAGLKCGPHIIELTECLARLGVPVTVHLGLTPQHVKEVDYDRQGTSRDDVQEIPDLAEAHAGTSAFSSILRHVPVNLTKQVAETIDIPTADIGTGPDCGRQVLVADDVVGMSDRAPSFTTQFGDVKSEVEKAVSAYRDAVEAGEFPADKHNHVEDDLNELYRARDSEIRARARLRRLMPRGDRRTTSRSH